MSDGGCDSSATETRVREKDPKCLRALLTREPQLRYRRDPGLVVSVSRETRTGTWTHIYCVLLSVSLPLKPALNIGGI